jgi:hypothetical protein
MNVSHASGRCKWFIGGARPKECKELKWAILTKHWGMLEFAAKQVIMVVAQASMKNLSKTGCGGLYM